MAHRTWNVLAFGLAAALSPRFTVAQETAEDSCALAALEIHAAPELAALLEAIAQEPAPPTVTVVLEGVDVRTALEIITRAGDGNLVIAPRIEGKVTIQLKDATWSEAVARVAEYVGARVVPVETASGVEVLRVEPQLLTRRFTIAEAALCAAVRFWLSEGEPLGRSTDPAAGNAPAPASAPGEATVEAVKGLLSRDGTQKFDDSSCSFVIQDFRESLDAIGAALRERGIFPAHSPQSNASADPSLPADGNGGAGGAPDLNR